MIINKSNQMTISDLYIHDSIFENLIYEHEGRNVRIEVDNYELKKHFSISFCNIIYMELTGAQFWGFGRMIFDWEVIINDEKLNELIGIQSSIADEVSYFSSKITLNSGDTIKIICQEIIFEENTTLNILTT